MGEAAHGNNASSGNLEGYMRTDLEFVELGAKWMLETLKWSEKFSESRSLCMSETVNAEVTNNQILCSKRSN